MQLCRRPLPKRRVHKSNGCHSAPSGVLFEFFSSQLNLESTHRNFNFKIKMRGIVRSLSFTFLNERRWPQETTDNAENTFREVQRQPAPPSTRFQVQYLFIQPNNISLNWIDYDQLSNQLKYFLIFNLRNIIISCFFYSI